MSTVAVNYKEIMNSLKNTEVIDRLKNYEERMRSFEHEMKNMQLNMSQQNLMLSQNFQNQI